MSIKQSFVIKYIYKHFNLLNFFVEQQLRVKREMWGKTPIESFTGKLREKWLETRESASRFFIKKSTSSCEEKSSSTRCVEESSSTRKKTGCNCPKRGCSCAYAHEKYTKIDRVMLYCNISVADDLLSIQQFESSQEGNSNNRPYLFIFDQENGPKYKIEVNFIHEGYCNKIKSGLKSIFKAYGIDINSKFCLMKKIDQEEVGKCDGNNQVDDYMESLYINPKFAVEPGEYRVVCENEYSQQMAYFEGKRIKRSSIKIQAITRGFLDRRNAKKIRYDRRGAVLAMTIQPIVRGFLVRLKDKRVNAAILKIQAIVRGLFARRESMKIHTERKNAHILMEKFKRVFFMLRRNVIETKNKRVYDTILKIQAITRGFLGRSIATKMRTERLNTLIVIDQADPPTTIVEPDEQTPNVVQAQAETDNNTGEYHKTRGEMRGSRIVDIPEFQSKIMTSKSQLETSEHNTDAVIGEVNCSQVKPKKLTKNEEAKRIKKQENAAKRIEQLEQAIKNHSHDETKCNVFREQIRILKSLL